MILEKHGDTLAIEGWSSTPLNNRKHLTFYCKVLRSFVKDQTFFNAPLQKKMLKYNKKIGLFIYFLHSVSHI